MSARLFCFIGADRGSWQVTRQITVAGESLPPAKRLAIHAETLDGAHAWTLRGIVSNERYVERAERAQLQSKQQGLGRVEATRAALIPIRKNAAWWALTQEERRSIFEAQSRHIEIGLKYLPPIARRLHHCRDLSETEPFDFLTWFEFAPKYESAFDDLVGELRRTPEWGFVDREVDIRLTREG